MKFLALALASENERFIRGFPPKGANLFKQPNIEISRLVNLISNRDELIYLDERVDPLEFENNFNTALIFVNFGQEKRATEVVLNLSAKGKRNILFGPLPTFWKTRLPDWVDSVVTGSILNAYPEIREDLSYDKLKKHYISNTKPSYVPENPVFSEKSIYFNNHFQSLQAVLGCFCLPQIKYYCPQGLYYGNNILKRSLVEVIGEVLSLPFKNITLLDEDIASFPEYYLEFFTSVWNYKKHWKVKASRKIFDCPNLIRLMAKAGVKQVFLNEDWFPGLNPEIFKLENKKFRIQSKQVKILHSERMLVGAKLSLLYQKSNQFDFNIAFKILDHLNLDFLEIKLYQSTLTNNIINGCEIEPIQKYYYPMLPSTDPVWLKNRFYALGHITYRICTRPLTIGFYNTLFYLIPYSLAYRQNYLEGISYPP
jgi:hypothetical protein